LIIGVDPAGSSGDGDESSFCPRRGQKVIKFHTRRGLTEAGHVTEILGLIAMHRGDSTELPLVVLDRDGHIGAKVFAEINAYLHVNPGLFQLIGLRTGERARRKPLTYDRVRDEVWFGLVDAFREGLAIPEELKLRRELEVIKAETHVSGRSKITEKSELRKLLGRSPDRADSLCLACFETSNWVPVQQAQATEQPEHDPYRSPAERGLDPYAAMDIWRR
jgi:hypothetical protein